MALSINTLPYNEIKNLLEDALKSELTANNLNIDDIFKINEIQSLYFDSKQDLPLNSTYLNTYKTIMSSFLTQINDQLNSNEKNSDEIKVIISMIKVLKKEHKQISLDSFMGMFYFNYWSYLSSNSNIQELIRASVSIQNQELKFILHPRGDVSVPFLEENIINPTLSKKYFPVLLSNAAVKSIIVNHINQLNDMIRQYYIKEFFSKDDDFARYYVEDIAKCLVVFRGLKEINSIDKTIVEFFGNVYYGESIKPDVPTKFIMSSNFDGCSLQIEKYIEKILSDMKKDKKIINFAIEKNQHFRVNFEDNDIIRYKNFKKELISQMVNILYPNFANEPINKFKARFESLYYELFLISKLENKDHEFDTILLKPTSTELWINKLYRIGTIEKDYIFQSKEAADKIKDQFSNKMIYQNSNYSSYRSLFQNSSLTLGAEAHISFLNFGLLCVRTHHISNKNIKMDPLYSLTYIIAERIVVRRNNDEILFKINSYIDFCDYYYKRLINLYNKIFNLLALRKPIKVVDEFQGRGRLSISDSITHSIRNGKRTAMETYKIKKKEEPAYLFVSLDVSGSMSNGLNISEFHFHNLVINLVYGFYERFHTLVFGIINSESTYFPIDYPVDRLRRINQKYIEKSNSLNRDIAYNIHHTKMMKEKTIEKLNKAYDLLDNPNIKDKDDILYQIKILSNEYARLVSMEPNPKALLTEMDDAIKDANGNSYKTDPIKIQYGVDKKGAPVYISFQSNQTRTRKFVEFNTLKEFITHLFDLKYASGTSFVGASELIEHPLFMKGKGLKYFFAVTDAEVNEGAGGRNPKPFTGRWDVTEGMHGVFVSFERVATRKDSRFGFFLVGQVELDLDADDMKKLPYPLKSVYHPLNWSKDISKILYLSEYNYFIEKQNSQINKEIIVLNQLKSEGIILNSHYRYIWEESDHLRSQSLYNIVQNLAREDKYAQEILKEIITRGVKPRSVNNSNYKRFKRMEFLYNFYEKCFIVDKNTMSVTLSYLRAVYQRLAKMRYFIQE